MVDRPGAGSAASWERTRRVAWTPASQRWAATERVVLLMRTRRHGTQRANPVRGLGMPVSGRLLPGIEEHQAQHRLVLGILAQPGGHRLFQRLRSLMVAQADDVVRDDQ